MKFLVNSLLILVALCNVNAVKAQSFSSTQKEISFHLSTSNKAKAKESAISFIQRSKNLDVKNAISIAKLFYNNYEYGIELELLDLIRPYVHQKSDLYEYFMTRYYCFRELDYLSQSLNYIDSIQNITGLSLSSFEQTNLDYLKCLTLSDMGIYSSSNELGYKVLQQFKKLNNADYTSHTHTIIGYNLGKLNQFQKAISHFDSSVTALKPIVKPGGYYSVYLNIGDLYSKMARYEDAISYFNLALDEAKKVNYASDIILALQFLGFNYATLEEFDKASSYFDEATRVAIKNKLDHELVDIERSKLSLFITSKQFDKATKTIQLIDSLNVGKSDEVQVPARYRLHWMLETGQSKEAINYIKRQKLDSVNASQAVGYILRNVFLTKAYLNSDSVNKAKQAFDEVFSIYLNPNSDKLSGINKASFTSYDSGKIRYVAGALIKSLKDPAYAFRINELVKGFIASEQIRKKLDQNKKALPDSIQLKLLQKRELLAHLKQVGSTESIQNQTDLQREIEVLEMSVSSSDSAIKNTSDDLPTLKEVQQDLDDESLLIHLLNTDDGYYVLFISNSETKSHFITDKKKAQNLIENYNQLLRNPESKYSAIGTELFSMFAGGYESWIMEFQNWTLALDEVWLTLPIDALIYQDAFIAQSKRIRWIQSVGVADQLLKAKRWYTQSNMLVLSNPFYPENSSWSALPFSELEANSIQENDFNVTSLSQKDGSVSQFIQQIKNTQPRYIHIASHGITDKSPELNRLVFSFDTDETEGLFYPHHLNYDNLQADLVVLSACETAQGKYIAGEGVWGMQRVWMTSGAESVLASMWKINDQSTALFMKHFYSNIASSNGLYSQLVDRISKNYTTSHKAIAVQKAKLELIQSKKYKHPYYWAAFYYSGL